MKMKNKVLAVLVLALLMINMVPVREAKAATTTDGKDYPDLLTEVPLGDNESRVKELVESNQYIVVTKTGNKYYYFLSPSATRSNQLSATNKTYRLATAGVFPIEYDSSTGVVTIMPGASGVVIKNGSNDYVIGSNYDYRDIWNDLRYLPYNNLSYPTLPPVSIPDAEFDSYDRLGFTPQNVDATYLADGIWNITYNPSILEYYMWYSVRISTPHIYMVEDWDGMPDEQILDTTAIDNWRKGMTDYYDKVFDVLDVMPSDDVQQFTTAGYFGLDIKTLLQERWSDLYPNIDISMLEYVCEYAYPQVIVTRSFYIDYGSRVFGPANITRLTKLYSRNSEVNQEDILWGGGIASDSISAWLGSVGIQTGNKEEIDLNVALKEEIEQLKIERQTYLEQIAALESQIHNMVNGDNIFDTFSNIANGLKSMSGSVRNVALAVGNVFAFFPGEITTILLGGFVACIVIAVYKALRG